MPPPRPALLPVTVTLLRARSACEFSKSTPPPLVAWPPVIVKPWSRSSIFPPVSVMTAPALPPSRAAPFLPLIVSWSRLTVVVPKHVPVTVSVSAEAAAFTALCKSLNVCVVRVFVTMHEDATTALARPPNPTKAAAATTAATNPIRRARTPLRLRPIAFTPVSPTIVVCPSRISRASVPLFRFELYQAPVQGGDERSVSLVAGDVVHRPGIVHHVVELGFPGAVLDVQP